MYDVWLSGGNRNEAIDSTAQPGKANASISFLIIYQNRNASDCF